MEIDITNHLNKIPDLATKIHVLCQNSGVIRVPLQLHETKQRTMVNYDSSIPIRVSPLKGTTIQFAAFHQCLVMTIVRPVVCTNLMMACRLLPEIPGFGFLTWASQVIHKKTYKGNIISTSIPKTLWDRGTVKFPSTLNTVGYVSNLYITYKYPTGNQIYNFSIIQIPAIGRRYFGTTAIEYGWHFEGK